MKLSKQLLLILLNLQLFLCPLAAQRLSAELSKKIWNHIYAEKYEEARKLIKQNYRKYRKNLQILSLYEITLNGLGEKENADKIHRLVLKIWNKNHKNNFIKANYPLNLSSYIRIAKVMPKKLILGYQYFTPDPIKMSEKREGHYYHKILVFDRENKRLSTLYKLEKSKYTKDQYILYQVDNKGIASEVRNYSTELPQLRDEILHIMNLQK
ncbi:MAG: hypothetical protein AAF518_10770 [Spirochaetota bacterium]